MDNADHVQLQNPWWRKDFNITTLKEHSLKPRFAFLKTQKILRETKLMLQISGLRRLGKSTLMKHLILDLIENQHVATNKIVFYEFSELYNNLEFVLQSAPAQSYLFLDEIQYCQDWKDILKHYYDIGTAVKIVFSGSATISYTKNKESLLGRFMPLKLSPLNFAEYLYLKYGDYEENPYLYNQTELWEFLEYGEFPELLSIESHDLKKEYLQKSVLEPLFTQDVFLYNIEKRAEFANLFKVVSADLGQIINKQNIAQEIGISRVVVDKYLNVFEDLGLVKIIPNYYKGARQVLGSDKKVYTVSLNLSLAYLGIRDLKNFPANYLKGHVFENFVLNELSQTYDTVYYWKRQQKEVDFVVQKGAGEKMAYEVKSKKIVSERETDMYRRYTNQIGAELNMICWDIENPQSALRKLILSNIGSLL
ncbi:MAG: ATP-binding protein [bacterium]